MPRYSDVEIFNREHATVGTNETPAKKVVLIDSTTGAQYTVSSSGGSASTVSVSAGTLNMLQAGTVTVSGFTGTIDTLEHSGTVNISGTVPVSASDLDIRDLSSAQDSILAVQSGSWNVGGTVSTTGTTNVDLKIDSVGLFKTSDFTEERDIRSGTISSLEGTSDVSVVGGTLNSLEGTVDVNLTNTATVSATDLDIRDLTSASDSIEVLQDTAADLNVTEANSGAIKTAVETIDDAISGNEMQVDVITLPNIPGGTLNALQGTSDVSIVSGTATVDKKKVSTGSIGSVDVTSSAGTILASNASRLSALLQNVSTIDVALGFSTAVTISDGLILGAASDDNAGDGGAYETDVYTGDLCGIVSAGTAVVKYMQVV